METRTYRSRADTRRLVSQDYFILSLLRDPNSNNPEYAALVIEGMNQFGKAFLRKYDYLDNDEKDSKADIQILEIPNIEVAEVKNRFTENLLLGKEYYSYSWEIQKDDANRLHENILKEKSNPPEYRKSLKGLLGAMKSDAPDFVFGESCLEWAIKHVEAFEKSDISKVKGDLEVFKQYSRHIEGKTRVALVTSCIIL